jgi:GMP reductase
MKIENEVKLDFKDVLIRPKRSTLGSRKDVLIERTFTFKHTNKTWTGVPIIAANMDTVGTFDMYDELRKHEMVTALHKHYTDEELVAHFTAYCDPLVSEEHALALRSTPDINDLSAVVDRLAKVEALKKFTSFDQSSRSFYSMGITNADYEKFTTVMKSVALITGLENIDDRCGLGQYHESHPISMVCVDVANGYSENFAAFIRKLRFEYPNLVIMAGNVVTNEMTEELILAGADIVKVGIGPGSVCTTRKMTGVGYPQLSTIIECADAAHGLGGLVCADGGCTVPGDIAKAFGAGADFVMLGGMLAGHDESAGEIVTEYHRISELEVVDGQVLDNLIEERQFKTFYGMSSHTAMDQYSGGVAKYKASEGKTVKVPYRGPVSNTVQGILGGLRSACSYVGASKLKDLSKRTTFIRVTQQINEVFGKAE